jgi:dihydrofolate synthase/folylpolyglutamate synthase
MNYLESRTYIEEAAVYGSVLGLGNMQEMLGRLGHPEDDLKYIHVAGTNGKGSAIAYLYTTLREGGYRVGRYISPTLYSYRERMEVAGERVTKEAFARYVTRIAQVISDMTREGLPHPTPFEIETAAAILFFQEEHCDLVLLEVGMGGNLDATNVIRNTLVAVLMSISIDHQAFLGNTLAEIAEKKAGILKPGCHVISTRQQMEAAEVIQKAADKIGVPLRFTDPSLAEPIKESLWGQSFLYQGETYEIALSGVCQIENAVAAIEVLKELDTLGYPTTTEQKKAGLKKTRWNGRFTLIHEDPLILVDGSHNPGAADMLEKSIRTYLKGRNIYYIMGMFKDKDYNYVIDKTIPYAKEVFAIETPDNPRALPVGELAEAIRRHGGKASAMPDLSSAVAAAMAKAGREDVILVFGSLSFLGEITKIVEEKRE